MDKKFIKQISGMSLIEMLIVVAVFAILGIIVSASIILTIQGSKKSESQIKIRENLNYALAVIERNVRNANSIVDCGSGDGTSISYIDQYGVASSFSCENMEENDSYIASGEAKARLTANTISVTSCSFTCDNSNTSIPPIVTLSVAVKDASGSGSQSSTVSAELQIYLRN